MAGLMYWGDPRFLEDLLAHGPRKIPTAPANNYFFDAVAWHVYSRPTEVYERVQRSRLLLQTYVGHKADLGERGQSARLVGVAAEQLPRFPLSGTLEEQAAWVVQWYAYALAAGARPRADVPDARLGRAGGLGPGALGRQPAARLRRLSACRALLLAAHERVRATLGDVEQIVFERPGPARASPCGTGRPRPLTAADRRGGAAGAPRGRGRQHAARSRPGGAYHLRCRRDREHRSRPWRLPGGRRAVHHRRGPAVDAAAGRRRAIPPAVERAMEATRRRRRPAAAASGPAARPAPASASPSAAPASPGTRPRAPRRRRALQLDGAPLAEVDLHSHSRRAAVTR